MGKRRYQTINEIIATAFFGWTYWGDGSQKDMFKIKARASATKRNDKGQVYAADIYTQESYHQTQQSSRHVTESSAYYGQGNLELIKTSDVDVAAAILAIPAIYGNYPQTQAGKANQGTAWRAGTWHEYETYYYYFVIKLKFGKDKIKTSNPNPSVEWPGQGYYQLYASQGFQQITEDDLILEKPSDKIDLRKYDQKYSREDNTITLNSTTGYVNLDDFYNNLYIANNSELTSRKTYAYDQSYGFLDDGMLAGLKTGISHWKDMPNNSTNNIWVHYLPIGFLPSLTTSQKMMANVTSGFPIFEVHNFDEMVKYFEGEDWTSDNDPLPEDWSTDWDVYVKGAQRPQIYITMKSDKLDAWLKSDSNKTGTTKNQIKVEWQYPEYEDPVLQPTIKLLEKTKYNDMKETSYTSQVLLNYPNLQTILDGLDYSDELNIDTFFQYYAQLRFRLYYDVEHRSAWCRFKIGVIGSPSVPDFSYMENEGVQDDENLEDDSTVTLHYDKVPDDADPYPTPPVPPSPPPKPTDPVPPPVNGTGLLTTTYKVTEGDCKNLGKFFWGGDFFQKIKALNTSPIENVVGLTIMPVNVAGTPEAIVIGNVDTNINGDKIGTVPVYDLGSFEWKGRYHSFLDYEPYTTAHIFLPYVGFVRLDPAYFTYKTLSVKYTFDIIAGLCNALLFADDIYVESHQGHCGISIPLIATNRADMQIGLASSLVVSAGSIAATAASGGVLAPVAVGAAVSAGNAVGSYATGFHSQRQTGYSPTCAWYETKECYVVIESVNASHSSTYNKDRGRPCLATANVGSLSGYTEIDANVDLSGFSGATETERQELRNILSSGFYV